MSSGVSQIDFWRKDAKPVANESSTNVKEGGEGATYLSYDVFLGLSVLGGFLALDHLYLRSPLTFLAKIVVNILFLGVWWIYDASQAVFNKDVVKVFGLGVPGLGPKGIAAGVLGSSVPDKKHMAFFGYGLALFFGGLFGLDSFIVGDNKTGLIRLVSLITLIFAPIALFWWLYKLFKFFFKTKEVISENWEYFGAPPPATITEKFVANFPFLGNIFGPILDIFGSPAQTAKTVIETAIKPVTNVAVPIAKEAIDTAKTAIETAKFGIEAGTKLGSNVATAVGKTANVVKTLGQASSMPSGPELSAFTVPQAAAALAGLTGLKQDGGGSNSNMLAYTLLGTFGIIAVSGFILTYRRSKQNAKPQRDDPPPNPSAPEPRVLSESNKKESS